MKRWIAMIGLFTLLFVVGACSAANESETEKEETDDVVDASTVQVDALGNEVQFDSVPETFGTLNGGDLDLLNAFDATIVARPTTKGPTPKGMEDVIEVGNPHQPNFEKLAEARPDVLIAPPSFQQFAANVENQGTKVIYTAANSIADIQGTIELYGSVLQQEERAKELNDEIDEAVKTVQSEATKGTRTLLVYGAPGTYLAALPTSLSGDLLEKAGGENIASDFPQEEEYPQYASLSVEKIIERNPEVVMLITHGEPEAVRQAFEAEMDKNPAWKNLDAVKEGRVVVLPSHLFGTNPGTKIVDALHEMRDQLKAVE